MKEIITKSTHQTKELGESLAKFLKKKDVLALIGDLGSGKTTFVKGIARGLNIKEEEVISPSYVLIREYRGRLPLYHFDLYRLDYLEEVELLGYQDYFYADGITCIEWAKKIKEILPRDYLAIRFKIIDKNKRNLIFEPHGLTFKNTVKKLDPNK